MTLLPQGQLNYRFGPFEADIPAAEVRRNGRKLRLRPLYFKLLVALLERHHQVVSREELEVRLWPDVTVGPGSLGQAVRGLRQKLGDNAAVPRYIETVPTMGYKFIAEVKNDAPDTPAVEAAEEPEGPQPQDDGPALPAAPDWRRWAAYSLALLAGLLAGYAITKVLGSDSPTPPQVRRFSIEPAGRIVQTQGPGRMLHISPDGRRLAYVTFPPTGPDGLRAELWLHDLRTARVRPVEGVEFPKSPFWSPDSESLFFGVQSPNVELYRMPAQGGPAIKITDVPGLYRTASISDEGTIYFHGGSPGRAWKVSAGGGDPAPVLTAEELEKIFPDGDVPTTDVGATPLVLPAASGKRGLIFGVSTVRSLYVLDLESRMIRPLFSGVRDVVWSPTGHLLYVDQFADLWAVPFSLDELAVAGDRFRIAQDVVNPTVADDGTLAYFKFTSVAPQLVLRDRGGKVLETIGEGQDAKLSPDGSKVVFSAGDPHRTSIEVLSLQGGPQVRIAEGRYEIMPVWSGDGKQVAFTSNRGEDVNIYIKTVDSDDKPVPLLADPGRDFPEDWSLDNRFLIFNRNDPFTNSGLSKDLFYAERDPETGEWTENVLRQTEFAEALARLSPDGRYFAYGAFETGRRELIVRDFPNGSKSWILPRKGRPQRVAWSKESGEIFYQSDGVLYAIHVSTQPEFSFSEPVELFATGKSLLADVSADGRRLLFEDPPADPPKPLIWIVENWYEEFREQQVVAR